MNNSEILSETDDLYQSYDWDGLARAGFDKRGDYCFIYAYPPIRTLKPIAPSELFTPSAFGGLSEPANLYVHVPYCTGICSYCYFAKVVDGPRAPVPRQEYPTYVRRELELFRERSKSKPSVASVHFGGGTPSLLAPHELGEIMEAFKSHTVLQRGVEVTVECAPETVDGGVEKLRAFSEVGVNRLNLGVESLDDRVLAIMGRRHKCQTTFRALETMQESGIGNINVDLIYGLPGQSLQSWVSSLLAVCATGITSLSVYRLRRHPMKRISMFDPSEYPSYEDGLKMQIAHEVVARRLGFIRASSHKYARGAECLQEQVENKRGVEKNQLLAVGCGAYGFVNGTYYWNTKSLSEYGERLRRGELPTWIGQCLTKQELMRKSCVMGMHTNRGVSLDGFSRRYGVSVVDECADAIERMRSRGLIHVKDGYLCPTEMGRFFSDEISVEFYSDEVKRQLASLGMKYGMFFENDRYA